MRVKYIAPGTIHAFEGVLPAGTYRVVASGQTVNIHPSSVLCGKKARCIVFGELVATTRHYARQVSAIEPAWLVELAPAVFSSGRLPTS